MKVFSGSCYLCDSGIPTGEVDMHGRELFTGDIVQLWHGNWIGQDLEEWMPSDGLTAIVADQYQSYSDGSFEIISEKPRPFTMGIKDVGVQGGAWKVSLVKSHKDIVHGERFPAFGFNFWA